MQFGIWKSRSMTDAGLTMSAESYKDFSRVCVHYSSYTKTWSAVLATEKGAMWMASGETRKECLQALQIESGRKLGGLI